jgi:hypothetical protein
MGCMLQKFSDMEGNRPFQPLLKTLQKELLSVCHMRDGRRMHRSFDRNKRTQVLRL